MTAIRERRTSRRTFSRLAILGLAAGMLTVAAAPPATAMPILDQSFTTSGHLVFVINEGCKYAAQSFTVGVTGMLTGVNIDVQKGLEDVPPLRVVIRHSRHNRPFGPPVGSRSLADPQAPLTRLIAFDESIPVVAGEHYAIQVNYQGAEPGAGQGLGAWYGGFENEYPGGRAAAGDCPGYGSTFWYVDPSYDLHFRTYVEPTP
jgi:hypothetical protein